MPHCFKHVFLRLVDHILHYRPLVLTKQWSTWCQVLIVFLCVSRNVFFLLSHLTLVSWLWWLRTFIALWFIETIALFWTLLNWHEWSLHLHDTPRSGNCWFWSSVNGAIGKLDWLIIIIFFLSIIWVEVNLGSTHLIWGHDWCSGDSHRIQDWRVGIFLSLLVWLRKLVVVSVLFHLMLVGGGHDTNAVAGSRLWVPIVGGWRVGVSHPALEWLRNVDIVPSHWPCGVDVLCLVWILWICLVISERSIVQITMGKLIVLPIVIWSLRFSARRYSATRFLTLSGLILCRTHVFLV